MHAGSTLTPVCSTSKTQHLIYTVFFSSPRAYRSQAVPGVEYEAFNRHLQFYLDSNYSAFEVVLFVPLEFFSTSLTDQTAHNRE